MMVKNEDIGNRYQNISNSNKDILRLKHDELLHLLLPQINHKINTHK
jgi:hypothetical protein